MTPEISIIIPCYNGTTFIHETLDSIFSQDESNFEIILVDDGSTDNLREFIQRYNDPRLFYYNQSNQGVSAARNTGYKYAKGNYIVFFDADDKMEQGFLKNRHDHLAANTTTSFVCGEIHDFTSEKINTVVKAGATEIEPVLFYAPLVSTCPSNYMFRKQFLDQHQLHFNTTLSSTADRFFLLQCFKVGKAALVKREGKLLYRITPGSMSGNLTPKLVKDNELYYQHLLSHNLIPRHLLKKSLLLGYMMLAKAHFRTNQVGRSARFLFKAVLVRAGVAV